MNIEEENDVLIYLVSFLGSLAVLPGNIISALFMDKIGRIKMIGEIIGFTGSNAVFCTSQNPLLTKRLSHFQSVFIPLLSSGL